MLSLKEEFVVFVKRGNVVDLAVGVIIGASFGKIVTSLVNDVLMPPLGLMLGNADFTNLTLVLSRKVGGDPDVVIRYGAFLNTLVDFLIVAMAIFLMVKAVNRLMPAPVEEFEPTTKDCPMCCNSIPFDAKKCGFCCTVL